MKMEQIELVFKEIQAKIPAGLRNSVVVEVDKTPTMKMLAEKMIEEGIGTDKEREQVKNLLDSGYFSQKRYIENAKVAKQIDNLVSREINKAVKSGRLPKNALDIPEVKQFYERIHNQ